MPKKNSDSRPPIIVGIYNHVSSKAKAAVPSYTQYNGVDVPTPIKKCNKRYKTALKSSKKINPRKNVAP